MRSKILIERIVDDLSCSKTSVIRALKRVTRDNDFILREPSDWSNHECVWFCAFPDREEMLKMRHAKLVIPFEPRFYIIEKFDYYYYERHSQKQLPTELCQLICRKIKLI